MMMGFGAMAWMAVLGVATVAVIWGGVWWLLSGLIGPQRSSHASLPPSPWQQPNFPNPRPLAGDRPSTTEANPISGPERDLR